jgi:hypothetical protein
LNAWEQQEPSIKKFTRKEVPSLLGYSRQFLAAVLLGIVLLAGCGNISPKPAEVAGRNEPGKTAQTKPEQAYGQPEAKQALNPSEASLQRNQEQGEVPAGQLAFPGKEAAATAGQPVPSEGTGAGTTPGKPLPVGQEKPLVIVSENPVFAGTGQLLEELDKELEFFLGALETMDDIQAEDLNF